MICCAEDEQKYDFCSKHYFAKFNVTFFSEENEIGPFSSLKKKRDVLILLEKSCTFSFRENKKKSKINT